MRLRFLLAALGATGTFVLYACGFGIDVDSAFGGGGGGSSDGAPPPPVQEAGIPSVDVQAIAAGDGFTCGLRVDGTVMCWGQNVSGRLGNGANDPSSVPVLVQNVTDAVDLAVGAGHACVVRKSGAVACWGTNDGRQLGDGTTDPAKTPRPVVALSNAKNVAAGAGFTCALLADATVSCWGNNDDGELGDGTTTARSQPAPVTGLTDVVAIGTSFATACAVVKSGDVYCWGRNDQGQAAVAPPAKTPTPSKVDGVSGVVAITSSGTSNHFCATLGTGELRCWGYGNSGELGNAKGQQANPKPTNVVSVTDAAGADTGSSFTCAWRKTGDVVCFGDNGWRKLGLGDSSPPDGISSPLPVVGLTGVKQIAAGSSHACALHTDGKRISCWGANTYGTLGRGTRIASEVPVKAAFPGTIAKLGAGRATGFATDEQGTLFAWGINDTLMLGTRDYAATGTPTAVKDLAGPVKLANGGINHACAVLTNGNVQCWGHAQYGEVGNGQTPYVQLPPDTFQAGGPAIDVGGGYEYTCVLRADGQIACSGYATGDQRLGFPSGNTATPGLVVSGPVDPDAGVDGGPPPPAPPFSGATRLSVGGGHACVLHGTALACWGSNDYGQRGASGQQPVWPVDVPLPGPVAAFACGGGHTCAALQDGSVQCWGANDHGQLSGSDSNGPKLRAPALGKKATQLAAGDSHTCALLEDGTVSCWGAGTSGELGNGVRSDAPTPQAVKNLTGVTQIAADEHFTCALLADKSVQCWGSNTVGQLGDGSTVTTGTPASVVGY